MPRSIKIIKGREYLYYTYYEEGKKKDRYCGLASRQDSIKKSMEFELEYLKNQSENYGQQAKKIEEKLQKMQAKQ